jgi:hypothetical protein
MTSDSSIAADVSPLSSSVIGVGAVTMGISGGGVPRVSPQLLQNRLPSRLAVEQRGQ